MLSFKHGAEVGSCSVIQHQTEEAMAALLLARAGEGNSFLRKYISIDIQNMITSRCHGSSGEGICVSVG